MEGSEPCIVQRLVMSQPLNHAIEVSWPVVVGDGGDEMMASVASLLPSFYEVLSPRLGDLVSSITSSAGPPLFPLPTPLGPLSAMMDVYEKTEMECDGKADSSTPFFLAVSPPPPTGEASDTASFAITPDGIFHLRITGREGYESLGLVGQKSKSSKSQGPVNSRYHIRVKLNSRTFKEGRGYHEKVKERLNTLPITSMWILHDPRGEEREGSWDASVLKEWNANKLKQQQQHTSHMINNMSRIPLPSREILQNAANSMIGHKGQEPDSASLFHALHDWLGGISCGLRPSALDSILELSPLLLNENLIKIDQDGEESLKSDPMESVSSAIRSERWTGLVPSHRIFAIINKLQDWMASKEGIGESSPPPPWISFACWGIEGVPMGLPGEREPCAGSLTHYRILLLPGAVCTFEAFS